MAESVELDRGGQSQILARTMAFKRKLRAGGTVIGAWLSFNDPAAAEIIGRTGFDFVIIDTEHGPWDLVPLQVTLMGLNGTNTVPIIRVPWNDHVRIKQVLDLGAEGILAPMVKSVAECEALVAACRYPPVGTRGFGPRRASNYYRDLKAYETIANEAIFVMPQIEDVATLAVLDDFVKVPGIDAIAIGPNDMSGTAGVFRDPNHPNVMAVVDRICAAATKAGIPVCLGVNTPAEAQKGLVAKGIRILTVAADVELLASGARRALQAAQEALK